MPKIASLCDGCHFCGKTIGCSECSAESPKYVRIADLFKRKNVDCIKKASLQEEYEMCVLWCDTYTPEF